ncbi:MAG0490 family ComEA-like DNA-binding protein [Mycoplasmopsis adleri]|uniref:MAG0490 family ComEA-like DNA-binding protein n=1 Tax=Mycoplasmopsis adleri TaxID=51362 RepID=UPI003873015E
MKAKWNIFLGVVIGIASVGAATSIAFSTSEAKIKPIDKNKESGRFKVVVKGCVQFPDTYYFDKPTSLKEIFSICHPLNNADLSSFDLNQTYATNTTIVVDKKQNSLHNSNNEYGNSGMLQWSQLNNTNQLTSRGISKSIAQKIINLRKNREYVTWNDISNIKGVGEKTLKKLQSFLSL